MNEKLHRIWKAKDVYFVTISKPKWKLTQGSFEGYVSLEEGWVRRNSNKKRPKVDGVQPNGDVTLLKYFYVFISVSQFFFFCISCCSDVITKRLKTTSKRLSMHHCYFVSEVFLDDFTIDFLKLNQREFNSTL